MSNFKVTLVIDTVGDKQAMAALDTLAAKGKVVSGATDGMGKATKAATHALNDHTPAVHKLGRAMESLATETLGAKAQFGLMAGELGKMAVGGTTMLAVTAGIFAITKAYEVLGDRARKAKEEAKAVADEFSRIAHLSVVGQGQAAQLLTNGDPFNFQLDDQGRPALERFSLADLKRQRAQFDRERRQFITGAGEGGGMAYVSREAKDAEELFHKIDKEIQRRQAQLQSILGPGGTMGLAGQFSAAADAALGTGPAATSGQKLGKAVADAYEKELARDLAAATKIAVAQGVADAEVSYEAQHSILDGLIPTKEQITDAIRGVGEQISAAIASDPVLNKGKAVHDLAVQLSAQLTTSLKEGLANAFEVAFSGGGFEGGFKALAASVLGAFGTFLEQLGASMFLTGTLMEAFVIAMHSLNGPAMAAAGVALMAAGAGMKALAGSFGGGAHAGASYGGGYSSSTGLGQIIDRGTIDPNSYSSRKASDIPVRSNISVPITVIGANDPQAQRQIAELVTKAAQRGWIGVAPAR